MMLDVFSDGYSHESRLVMVGVRTHTGEFRHWEELEGFLEYFMRTDDKIVVGFNILKWGLPFLMLKAQGLDRFPEFFRKVNQSNVTDLFTVLTFQNRGTIKGLDFYLDKFRINRDFPSDSEMVSGGVDSLAVGAKRKLEAMNALYWKMRG